MTEATATPQKHWFRVHFHDGRTRDEHAVNALVAEKNARARTHGGYVKKIKRLKEVRPDAG